LLKIPTEKLQTCGGDLMKTRILSVAVFAFAAVAGAQTKQTGTLHCAKADPSYTVEVPDHAGHAVMLQKLACTWTTSLETAGLKSVSAVNVETDDATATKMTANGTHVTTTDNGDKYFVSYHGTSPMKDGKPGDGSGTWMYTGGTGKLKGIKGKGTYTIKFADDGTATAEVTGEYTLPAAAPAKPKAK
jgi:uncharacterized protein GlcG (DUF336 family)